MSSAMGAARQRSLPRRLVVAALLFARHQIRASELWLIFIAAAVGVAAGLATLAVAAAAHGLQSLLFGIAPHERLSAIGKLSPWRLPVLPIGGLLLGLITWAWGRRRSGAIVDPVEANALRGGRMSLRDSLFLGLQSIISNGFGASVGLEAAYAQLGAALASVTGSVLNLRRSDLRTFVGAGAGAAIAAAFGAPLTGAFYAFEIIIGSYTIANIAPVVAAALAGAMVTRLMRIDPLIVPAHVVESLRISHYLLFAALGVACALFGVAVMRGVAASESLARRIPVPRWARPALGGLVLGALALFEPQTLSAGHGALHLDLTLDLAIQTLVVLLLAKAAASVVALGFGYRGGLFFASLYLGSMLGRIFILGLNAAGLDAGVDPLAASLVGMGAMAVAIIGGPFTMSFLVLETTGDFGLAAVTLTASIVASVLVRETFGYSFSTWRLHLRGETIRSAHDVGWLRTLTAGRMMRPATPTVAASLSLEEFRRRFPLGSTRRVVALDAEGRYAGLIPVSAAFAEGAGGGEAGDLARNRAQHLSPQMTIKEIMGHFDSTQSDELAVVADDGTVVGVLSESYATRRYAEELEKNRRDLVGGD